MAVAAPPWFLQQLFDNDGLLLAGGFLHSYVAYTTTPLATFTDATGDTENLNPIELDGSGRMSLWLYEDRAYTFVLTDEFANVIQTIDNVLMVPPVEAVAPTAVDIYFELLDESAPLASQWLGGAHFRRPVTFPADLLNSGFSIVVSAAAETVWSCRLNSTNSANGTEVATLTFQTDDTYVFATTDNVEFSVAIGDRLDWYGPDPADGSSQGFVWTMVGRVTGVAPGDYVTQAELDDAMETALLALLPAGSGIIWYSETPPTGWLECDGSELSRATYSRLYTKIGTRWGIGNGTTTFNLPNSQGVFLRGWANDGIIYDVGRTMDATVQLDQLQGFVMAPLAGGDHFKVGVNSGGDDSHGDGSTVRRDDTTGAPVDDGTNGDPRIGPETRPVNLAVMFIIKY